jgi:hypothetical protein
MTSILLVGEGLAPPDTVQKSEDVFKKGSGGGKGTKPPQKHLKKH